MVSNAGIHAKKPRLEIEYCNQCKWLLRAAWMAQELLSTFSDELGAVSLIPGEGGVYEIRVAGSEEVAMKMLWSRKDDGGFPEIKELKKRVRDVVSPDRDLGHVDS